ncbi:hypothetical protein QFC19_000123 [Naganishia cerealis]|uniref:Uncharacterized protein n=1 Tax=Naganishia cerealis TaxID=610337 RepID=A0ACC2WR69_9TREE|nr:hypothetical protein QFC19_000123 [Naganishia cerealis]
MPGSERSSVLKVNRLGSLMRDLEEEREAIEVVEARRRERRDNVIAERRARERLGGLDAADGEDEEVGEGGKTQQEVIEAFERQLLELFLDGMDAIPYEEIDFTEPAEGNPLLEQDAQDDYFDDEEEFDYRAARGDAPAEEDKLAEGEYDY